jgi:hypothetical protein
MRNDDAGRPPSWARPAQARPAPSTLRLGCAAQGRRGCCAPLTAINASRAQHRLGQPQRRPIRHLLAETGETFGQQPRDRHDEQQPRDIDPADAGERSTRGMRQVIADPAHT